MNRRQCLQLLLLTGLAGCGSSADSTGSSGSSLPPAGPVEIPGSRLPEPAAFLGPAYSVPVNGIQLAYRQLGAGPPLFLIMGRGGDMASWFLPFLRDLATSFSLTIYDPRGCGDSTDNLEQPYTLQLLAADAAGLIDALGLARPDVLGWSMGGETTLTLAVNYPSRVRRIITTGASPGSQASQQPAASEVAKLTQPASVEDFLSTLYPLPAAQAQADEYLASLAATRARKLSSVTTQRQQNAADAYHDDERTFNGLRTLQAPLLITQGVQDAIQPASNASLIANLAPVATTRLELFPAGGHAMHFQQTALFCRLVREFLR